MANDSKQYQEEEYIFSEDEQQADTFDSTDTSKKSSTDTGSVSIKESLLKTWRRNLFIGIGLVIVIFLVYKVVSIFFQPSNTNQITKIPSVITASAKPKIQMGTVNLPTKSTESSSAIHQAVNNYNQNRGEDSRLVKLETSAQTINAEVTDLQNSTQNLQASMDSVNTQLSQLNATLAVLTDKIQAQENKIVASKKKVKPRVITAPKIVKQELYYVLAIVPGRAWLKGSNGDTITVGAGTEIPGHGRVVNIDSQLGYVTTDSGSVIRYAPSDL